MDPLPRRLERAARAWLTTPITVDPDGTLEAARQRLAKLNIRLRDEDTVITPETDPDKGPRLLLAATDEGRVKPYAPIRALRLEFVLRGNTQLPAAEAEPFASLCADLELLLDSTNLQTALSNTEFAIAAMLAVRQPGCTRMIKGDLRFETRALTVKAVGAEHAL